MRFAVENVSFLDTGNTKLNGVTSMFTCIRLNVYRNKTVVFIYLFHLYNCHVQNSRQTMKREAKRRRLMIESNMLFLSNSLFPPQKCFQRRIKTQL